MKNFLSKILIGSLLGLGVFLLNPISGFCAGSGTHSFDTVTYTTPFRGTSFSSSSSVYFNVNDDDPALQYGVVPYSSFDVNVSLGSLLSGLTPSVSLSVSYRIDVSLLFTIPSGGAYSQPLSSLFLSFDDNIDSYNFNYHCAIDGIPTGIRIGVNTFATSNNLYIFSNLFDANGVSIPVSGSFTPIVTSRCSFTNFSFDQSSGSGSSTVINNVNSNLTPIGYSSLNFGVNGNVYFLEDNYIFKPDYISPLMFLYDFYNGPNGTVGSSALTLCMGDIASSSPVRGSPIAVIGDTRQGEYELTLGFCLGSAPTSSELSALTNLSNWGFEFNRGYSGDQFPMPSDARVSYTNFLDTSKNLYYVNVYFYFTSPDYFDSFLIRKAPSLRNIRVGAFAFNKYTGTISDQITVINEQWDSQIPNHSGFTSANSGASSAVSAMSGIESSSFGALNSAMTGASIDSFSLSTMSTPITTVSGLINQTYNILPSSIKWLISAILVIGILACIVSASRYTNTD